ncbi:MAG: hypothetical protein ACP5R4_09565 [Armatimonadota bacterium]
MKRLAVVGTTATALALAIAAITMKTETADGRNFHTGSSPTAGNRGVHAKHPIAVEIVASLSPKAKDPKWIARSTSLVVKARVARKEPAQWVKGHPVVDRKYRHPWDGDYAWHDFLFDEVEVIWKDQDIPDLGETLYVRVYDAKTPEIEFRAWDSPNFAEGERYILCLTNVDFFAYTIGPEHWRCSAHAAFLIVGDKVMRKGIDQKPFSTVSDLLSDIRSVVQNEEIISPTREWRAKQPHGTSF